MLQVVKYTTNSSSQYPLIKHWLWQKICRRVQIQNSFVCKLITTWTGSIMWIDSYIMCSLLCNYM